MPNAAEGEFMSNAAIGCLSFGARSERHTRPTAAEHSFGSVFYGVRKLLGKRSAGYRMRRLPDVVGRSKTV